MLDFIYGSHPAHPRRPRPAPLRFSSDLSRRALEAFSLEEYKAGRLTEPQLRQLLGLQTRDALDAFLKAHEVWLNYTKEDLERERAALRRLGFGT